MTRERLQKYLARCGVASRRASEQIITSGRVRVNGCFLERSRVGLDGPVELVVSKQGAVATILQQPASTTQFGFAAGCRLRLYIKNPKKAAEDNHAAPTN